MPLVVGDFVGEVFLPFLPSARGSHVVVKAVWNEIFPVEPSFNLHAGSILVPSNRFAADWVDDVTQLVDYLLNLGGKIKFL